MPVILEPILKYNSPHREMGFLLDLSCARCDHSRMVRHTINIPDDTDKQVKAVLGDRSLDEFAAEALRQHARREHAVEKLLSEVQEAEESGNYPGSLDDLGAEMESLIQEVESKKTGE